MHEPEPGQGREDREGGNDSGVRSLDMGHS